MKWAHRIPACVLSFLLAVGCASSPPSRKEHLMEEFLEAIHEHPEQVWSERLNPKAKIAIRDYDGHLKLKNGMYYGESVRHFDLRKRNAREIDDQMRKTHCERKSDVLKNPNTGKALQDFAGNVIPLIIYLCPDGGVVRIKPNGDPTSKFRPQPHGSKALRFPFDSKFESFDDEVVKVDNFGNAIPKWTQDMNPAFQVKDSHRNLIEGWAEDAHTDLVR